MNYISTEDLANHTKGQVIMVSIITIEGPSHVVYTVLYLRTLLIEGRGLRFVYINRRKSGS